MAYTNCKTHLLVLFILIQVFNISTGERQGDPISLDTEYVVEEFNLTWSIASYSQIFDTVIADFSVKNSLTDWRVSLLSKKFIILERRDHGEESANVKSNCTAITRYKTFHNQRIANFNRGSTLYKLQLLVFEEVIGSVRRDIPIEFENDIFKVHCAMKILGPSITKIMRSSDVSISDISISESGALNIDF